MMMLIRDKLKMPKKKLSPISMLNRYHKVDISKAVTIANNNYSLKF